MIAPCKDCKERHKLCHSTCEKYREYAEWNEHRREERYKVVNIFDRWSESHLQNARMWLKGRNDRWRNGK